MATMLKAAQGSKNSLQPRSTTSTSTQAHKHLKGPTAPHLAWKLTAMSCGLSRAACTTLNQILRSTLSLYVLRPPGLYVSFVAFECTAVQPENSRHARNNKHVHTLGRILTCLCNTGHCAVIYAITLRPLPCSEPHIALYKAPLPLHHCHAALFAAQNKRGAMGP